MSVAIWDMNEFYKNDALAKQHGFAFAGCMVCVNKDTHPRSDVCKECVADFSERNQGGQ